MPKITTLEIDQDCPSTIDNGNVRPPRRLRNRERRTRAAAPGDSQTAQARYTEFLDVWKDADEDRSELAVRRQ
jgi:hypothetical protein